jgi:hypothetical protein
MHRTFLWFALLFTVFPLTLSPAVAQKAPEIPAGTTIKIRTIDKLSSEEARVGDEFHATLEEPITVNDHELYPRGANVTGRVVDVHRSGRLSEPGELDLVLNTVTSGTRTSSLRVDPLVVKGQSHTKSNTTKIGGGAALGAIIGAIAGGGKGAAVGTVAGAAAGTGAAAATGKKEVEVAPETVLSFVTSTATDVPGVTASAETPSSTSSSSSSADSSPTESSPADSGGTQLFTLRDRRVISSCVAEHASELPSDVTRRSDLPSGDERNLQQGKTVPDSIVKKMQSLPLTCVEQLPKLPVDQERVLYDGRVMLIDSNNHILDTFDLADQR